MTEKDDVEEIFSRATTEIYPANKIIYNRIDEIWPIGSLDMSGCIKQ